jgi:DNA-binding GntR family transcriptional regulator
MYEVMCHLEGLCAQLCARRMSAKAKAELGKMQELGGKVAETGDATEYGKHNLAFHDLLYRGCQNEILENQVRALRRRLEPYRNYSFHLPNRIHESHAEHGQIVKLIHDGDSHAAEMSMRRHMDIQRSNFSDYLIMLAKALSSD